MVLTLPFQNLSLHQSILLVGLQQVILHLKWPILLYHDGEHDVDYIIQNLSASHTMFVTTVPTTPYRADLIKPQSTVFVANEPKVLNATLRKWDLWNAHGKTLVILDDPKNIQEWITQLWVTTKAVDVLVMMLNETVSFFTWFPYKKQECIDVKTISRLEPPDLFPDKIVPPLHGCPIKGMTSALPPLVVDDDHGMESKLFHVLAEKVSLKVEYVNLPEGEYVWTLFDDEGEPAYGLKFLWDNAIDILFSAMGPAYTADVSDFLPPHFKDEMRWFVPAPNFASKRTSILRAFTTRMWILVLSSFICTFATLLVVALYYGSSVFPIFFNTLAINLSIPSKIAKSQRFLVFIALTYFYSLHITTAYQSSLMMFLSDNPHEKPIKTLEDLQTANLNIMIHDVHASFSQQLAETPTYKVILRPEMVTYHSYLYLERIVETGKHGLLGPLGSFGYSLTSNASYFYNEYGFPKIAILKQTIMTSDVSFLMSRGHPLVPLFSKYILRLTAAGIPQHFFTEQLKEAPQVQRNIEPFGMDEIEGPFYLYLLLISISSLAWIFELMIYNIQKKYLNNGIEKHPRKQKTTFFRLGALLARKFNIAKLPENSTQAFKKLPPESYPHKGPKFNLLKL